MKYSRNVKRDFHNELFFPYAYRTVNTLIPFFCKLYKNRFVLQTFTATITSVKWAWLMQRKERKNAMLSGHGLSVTAWFYFAARFSNGASTKVTICHVIQVPVRSPGAKVEKALVSAHSTTQSPGPNDTEEQILIIFYQTTAICLLTDWPNTCIPTADDD